MPGTIRVSVLEAVDLPGSFSDGTSGKDVTVKVTLGARQFKTESRAADEGSINSWNSNFSFVVMNLRDKLVVAICDNEDQCLTQTCIEVPSIIEKGTRDEFVDLKGGGRIHLSMSFVLTDEERKKIERMRLAVSKRREEERSRRTVVFQNIQPLRGNDLEAAPVSAVTITEVDSSSTIESNDLQETADGPLGFGSTTKPLTPILVFDYPRAVGMQSRQEFKRMEKKTKFWAAENVSDEVKASINDVKSEEQNVRESAKNQGRDEFAVHANVCEKDKWMIEGQRVCSMLDSEPRVVANSFCKESTLFGGDLRKSDLEGGATHFDYENGMQPWDGQQALRSGHVRKYNKGIEVSSGQGQRPEARPGPRRRWAQKTCLETTWASPEKARRFVRVECSGQVSAPFQARARILKLIKAAAGPHEAYSVDRILQENHCLTDSIGAVLNKVVGGGTILLATLLMMWPLSEGSPHGSDRSNKDD